jgi:hypothetical protein
VRAVTCGYETIQIDVISAAAPAARGVAHVQLGPRSACSHCWSENALGQRVPVLPSTAAEEGKLAFFVDDAVAGWPSARLAEIAGAAPQGGATLAGRSGLSLEADPLAHEHLFRSRGSKGSQT